MCTPSAGPSCPGRPHSRGVLFGCRWPSPSQMRWLLPASRAPPDPGPAAQLLPGTGRPTSPRDRPPNFSRDRPPNFSPGRRTSLAPGPRREPAGPRGRGESAHSRRRRWGSQSGETSICPPRGSEPPAGTLRDRCARDRRLGLRCGGPPSGVPGPGGTLSRELPVGPVAWAGQDLEGQAVRLGG
ncbi:unnamed protein product [Pipistrellus nathusii]|uniref:Uncharacterized protein n=1 Tax=Pipistrellus nathusii TaxID=59473 RepID=A0ABN9Z2W7_PIPNA